MFKILIFLEYQTNWLGYVYEFVITCGVMWIRGIDKLWMLVGASFALSIGYVNLMGFRVPLYFDWSLWNLVNGRKGKFLTVMLLLIEKKIEEDINLQLSQNCSMSHRLLCLNVIHFLSNQTKTKDLYCEKWLFEFVAREFSVWIIQDGSPFFSLDWMDG